jgi:16S rRNA (uracil1498-N3)-methyltransferase
VNDDLRRSAAHVFVADIQNPVANDDDMHHLSRVLRLRAGQKVSVSDGRGAWRICEWRDGLLVSVGDVSVMNAPTDVLTVALSPVKGDRTDWAIEKLVEVGIDRIVVLAPVERSVVRWDDAKSLANIDRFRRISRAAAAQCRRVFLPVIEGPVPLSDVVAGTNVAIAEPGGSSVLDGVTTIVVGPEGGFTEGEVALAGATVDLGPTVLRADTAAVVAATLMVAHSRR